MEEKIETKLNLDYLWDTDGNTFQQREIRRKEEKGGIITAVNEKILEVENKEFNGEKNKI